MKRMMTLVISMILALGLCAGAVAEEVAAVEIGGVFTLSCPTSMEVIELTEDDALENMVYAATSDELELYVYLIDTDGSTKEELYAMYQDTDSPEQVTIKTVGDIEYLEYKTDEELGAVYMISADKYYEILFYCETDDAMNAASAALQSIALM